jgi:hypothetical protein
LKEIVLVGKVAETPKKNDEQTKEKNESQKEGDKDDGEKIQTDSVHNEEKIDD